MQDPRSTIRIWSPSSGETSQKVVDWVGAWAAFLPRALRDKLFQPKWSGRRDPETPTVFLHIPKSAGMAFGQSLAEALDAKSPLTGFDGCLFDGFDGLDSVDATLKASIHVASPIPATADLVCGHFALSTSRGAYADANFCAILREPFSRILSHWLYWRQHGHDELVNWGEWAERMGRARQPLAQFLADPELAPQTDNIAVRMLLWPDRRIPARDFIPPSLDKALVRDALARLRNLDYVDYLENPDLIRNVEAWLGVPFKFKKVNETRSAPPEFVVDLSRELTAACNDVLMARSRLDLQLWTEAVRARGSGVNSETVRAAVWKKLCRITSRFSSDTSDIRRRHSGPFLLARPWRRVEQFAAIVLARH